MADETANAAKRALEEDAAPADDAPAVKKQKTDAEEPAAAADGAGEQEAAGNGADAAGRLLLPFSQITRPTVGTY
jgi:hypothetical protein